MACLAEHFYSRISAISSGGNGFEIGWVESNHDYVTGNNQMILTTTETAPIDGEGQDPALHVPVDPGDEKAFRATHCGSAGDLSVCMQVWDGNSWDTIRPWNGVMRCKNGDGSGNCRFTWLDEAFSADGSWFNINGGSDYLRMRNIKIRRSNTWRLFSVADFSGDGRWVFPSSTYDICLEFAWYHFRFLRGTC